LERRSGASEPLRLDPTIAPDAVTGHWDGSGMFADQAVATLLGIDVAPRPKKARPSRDSDSRHEHVPAGTWQPIDWPIRNDYPDDNWRGPADDAFADGG
jgi:hypothetical protein